MAYGIFGENYGGVPGGFNISYADNKPAWVKPAAGSATYGGGGGTGSLAPNIATGTAQSNLAATPYNVQLADIINATNQAAQQAANAGRLGPQGQQIQANVLGNLEASSRGEVTPSEYRTLQSTVRTNWGPGFGVDSPAQYSDFVNRYLRTQYERQQDAAAGLSRMYADNPAAPIDSMGNLLVDPGTYASTANAEAARAQAERLAAQELAYKYAALNLGSGGGGSGSGGYRPSASEYNARPAAGMAYGGAGGGDTATGTKKPFDWLNSLGNYNPFVPADTTPYYLGGTAGAPAPDYYFPGDPFAPAAQDWSRTWNPDPIQTLPQDNWQFPVNQAAPSDNYGLPANDYFSEYARIFG